MVLLGPLLLMIPVSDVGLGSRLRVQSSAPCLCSQLRGRGFVQVGQVLLRRKGCGLGGNEDGFAF